MPCAKALRTLRSRATVSSSCRYSLGIGPGSCRLLRPVARFKTVVTLSKSVWIVPDRTRRSAIDAGFERCYEASEGFGVILVFQLPDSGQKACEIVLDDLLKVG